MQVLKFGGSSVANAKNINSVVAIVQQAVKNDDKIVVILSALGGITDALLEAATFASNGDISYKEKLHFIEQRHLNTCLLYTSDAADDLTRVDLGGRRI